MKKRKGVPALDRFRRFIVITDACHIWTGAKAGKGYGVFGLNGSLVYAHRFAYEQTVGPIPAGLVIDHLCRNHACVNPAHLEAVTQGENIRRGLSPSILRAMKAAISQCPQGHPYNAENTYISRGKRHCRICVAEASLAYAARNREKRALAAREYRKRLRENVSHMDMR